MEAAITHRGGLCCVWTVCGLYAEVHFHFEMYRVIAGNQRSTLHVARCTFPCQLSCKLQLIFILHFTFSAIFIENFCKFTQKSALQLTLENVVANMLQTKPNVAAAQAHTGGYTYGIQTYSHGTVYQKRPTTFELLCEDSYYIFWFIIYLMIILAVKHHANDLYALPS